MARFKDHGDWGTFILDYYKCTDCNYELGAQFDLVPVCQKCGKSDTIIPIDKPSFGILPSQYLSHPGRKEKYSTKEEIERVYLDRLTAAASYFGDIVGVAEAAEILGWQKQQVQTYITRGKFPKPFQRLSSGPLWLKKQIEQYRDSRQ